MSNQTMTDETYARFVADQLLTADQLNGVVDYLTKQDRLSRIKLTGIGIVGGFALSYADGALHVSPGCAVTSEGHLLWLDKEKTFRSANTYGEAARGLSSVLSSRRRGAASRVPVQPQIFELVEGNEGQNALTAQFVKGKAVAAFLNVFDVKPALCTGTNCDNKGHVRKEQLRFLIVPEDDCVTPVKFDAPPVARPRVVFGKTPPNSASKLRDLYATAAKEVFKQVASAFRALPLGAWLGQSAADRVSQCQAKLDALSQKKETEFPAAGFQYWHEFALDVAATCSEMRDIMAGLRRPEAKGPFPKHVMLGSAGGGNPNCRHVFWPSALLDEQRRALEPLRFLLERLHAQFVNFSIPAGNDIKIGITPGKYRCAPLGERPIPYYYKYQPLFEKWDFARARRGDSGQIASYSTRGKALKRDFWDVTFFRIEGHAGKPHAEALKAVVEEIATNNLPIHAISLPIEAGELPVFVDKPHIAIMHYVLRQEILADLEAIKLFAVAAGKQSDAPVYDCGNLHDEIDSMEKKLSAPLDRFDYTALEAEVQPALTRFQKMHSENIGAKLEKAPFAPQAPFERLVNSDALGRLKRVDELLRRPRGPSDTSAFERLLADTPGLEHLGGVESGGTFFLLYASGSGEVVADFSVPYRCAAPPPEVDLPLAPEGILPRLPELRPHVPNFALREQFDRQLREMDDRVLESETRLKRLREVVDIAAREQTGQPPLIDNAELRKITEEAKVLSNAAEVLAGKGDAAAPERNALSTRAAELIVSGLEFVAKPEAASESDVEVFLSAASNDAAKLKLESAAADDIGRRMKKVERKLGATPALKGRVQALKNTLTGRRP